MKIRRVPVFFLLACATARAQEGAESPSTTTVKVAASDIYRFDSDLKGAPGRVAVEQIKVGTEVQHVAGPQDIFRLSGGVEYLNYDFSSRAALIPGGDGLFDDVYALRLEGTYLHVYDAHWTGMALAATALAFESGADLGDSATFAIGAGALYRWDEKVTTGLILRLQSRLEDSAYLYPIPYVEWQIAPHVALKTEQKAGFGFLLSAGLDEKELWTLEPRIYYSTKRFRLDDGGALPEGVIEDERIAVDVGLHYAVGSKLTVGLLVGSDLRQEFSIEDEQGSDIDEVNTRPAPYFGLFLNGTF